MQSQPTFSNSTINCSKTSSHAGSSLRAPLWALSIGASLLGVSLVAACADSGHGGGTLSGATNTTTAGHAGGLAAANGGARAVEQNATPPLASAGSTATAPVTPNTARTAQSADTAASGAGGTGQPATKPAASNQTAGAASAPPVGSGGSHATTPMIAAGALIRGPEPTETSATKAGPYKAQQITSGFRDGPDFGGATIYYPGDAEPPFAMIVFCPGWLGTQASDAPWGPFMASHGIVFMNIDTNATADSVLQRKAAELDALASLKAEQTRADSPLKGKLDLDRVSLMGWSMGGGGAWLNGKEHPEIKALVTLAGHNATAGGAEPDKGLTVPTLMLAGTADTTILGLGMSQPVYEVLPESTPKLLYEVTGANHFDFNDPAFADGAPARYVLSWEKVYLEGDMRYYKFLLKMGPNASDFRTNLK